MRYETFGPFPFEPGDNHRAALKSFWDARKTDGSPDGLGDAIGVYVWTFTKRGRALPWNVGLTDRGFQGRFTQKETTFLRLLRDEPKAKIEVYLLALRTKGGRFRKPRRSGNVSTNDWLESMLIGAARAVNPDLKNTAKVSKLQTTIVDGYLNDKQAERSASAKSFSALLRA